MAMTETGRLRVLHVTPGLESGGAEMTLYKLVCGMDRERFASSVVSLTDQGPILGEKLRAAGIPVHCLGFRRGIPNPLMITALAQWIRRTRPDVVQTWMPHANLLGGIAARLAGRPPVIWDVQNADFDARKTKRQTLLVVQGAAWLSARLPQRIVCCSDAVLDVETDLGTAPDKLLVIPNGIDIHEFVPDPEARVSVRAELGLAEDTPLIGLMARFDPQKDHATFFRAAGRLYQERPEVHFVLCGSGVTPENARLSQWSAEAGVAEVTHLLGLRRDTARVTAALDAATCCSSYGESFALVLGEAMACGVPCVTTEMPGPVSVVGDQGWVVPIGDAASLANAWREMLQISPPERVRYGQASRQRITDHFSVEKMVASYQSLYCDSRRPTADGVSKEAACR